MFRNNTSFIKAPESKRVVSTRVITLCHTTTRTTRSKNQRTQLWELCILSLRFPSIVQKLLNTFGDRCCPNLSIENSSGARYWTYIENLDKCLKTFFGSIPMSQPSNRAKISSFVNPHSCGWNNESIKALPPTIFFFLLVANTKFVFLYSNLYKYDMSGILFRLFWNCF